MKKRRFATIVAATVALTAGLTPSASAQNIDELIGKVPCQTMKIWLSGSGLAKPGYTTRSELVRNIRNAESIQNLPFPLNITTATSASSVGDRALKCGIVKADSGDIFSQLEVMSSNLSSTLPF